ncbi:MAG: hypothetical protein ABIG84_00315 [archaeon]
MLFGFLSGKIDLVLPKSTFSPGETIKGTVHLRLKKPVKARKLEVSLICEEITTRRTENPQGSPGTRKSTERLCDITLPLDSEKEYTEKVYDFEITVPPDALKGQKAPDNVMGGVIGVMDMVSGTRRKTRWFVKANLDVPYSTDISRKQDIVIR